MCGTAQRRIGNRILVGGYLSVNGDQLKRSQIISDFYKITKDVIEVFPEKLTTLQDEMDRELDVEEVKQYIFKHFETLTSSTEALGNVDDSKVQAALKRAHNQNTKYLNR